MAGDGPAGGLAALLFALSMSASPAPAAPPKVVNGTPSSELPGVGAVVAISGGIGSSFCTGVLLSPRWVLTAAHCTDTVQAYWDAGWTVSFFVGPELAAGADELVEVVALTVHPDYDPASSEADIGLLRLQGDVHAAPVPLNDDPADASWIGRELTIMGYGVTSDGAGDGGRKRVGAMTVWLVDELAHIHLESATVNACTGDSGGPALEQDTLGQAVAAGIADYVIGGCVGGTAAYVRTDPYLDWVAGHTPFCVDDQPCDGSFPVFADGFESGGTGAWTAVAP